MNGYSYMQWKVAMGRMQDANLAATEITEQGQPTRPEAARPPNASSTTTSSWSRRT
jgi:hypothetical protein